MSISWEKAASWLSAYAVLHYAVLIGYVSFLFGVRGRMCNSIVTHNRNLIVVFSTTTLSMCFLLTCDSVQCNNPVHLWSNKQPLKN